MSFVFLMFAIGALAAGIAGALGANLTVQAIVFIVVSIALLVVLRPFLKGRIDTVQRLRSEQHRRSDRQDRLRDRGRGRAPRAHPVFRWRVERAH